MAISPASRHRSPQGCANNTQTARSLGPLQRDTPWHGGWIETHWVEALFNKTIAAHQGRLASLDVSKLHLSDAVLTHSVRRRLQWAACDIHTAHMQSENAAASQLRSVELEALHLRVNGDPGTAGFPIWEGASADRVGSLELGDKSYRVIRCSVV